MFNFVGIAAVKQYGDDVEAGRGVGFLVLGEPGEGGFADLPLFEGGYSFLGYAVGEAFAAFYFDKDNGVAVFGNNIDLATLAAKVPLDDFDAASLKERCG